MEKDRRPKPDAFGTIVRTLVENKGFTTDYLYLARNQRNTDNFLTPHLEELPYSQQTELGVLIINGISLGVDLWDMNTQRLGTEIFSRFDFANMSETSLIHIKDSYVQAVRRQRDMTDSQSSNSLLAVGETLTPHFARTIEPTAANEIQDAWTIATRGRKISKDWQIISERAQTMTAYLGLMFIEAFSSDLTVAPDDSSFTLLKDKPNITLEELRKQIMSREIKQTAPENQQKELVKPKRESDPNVVERRTFLLNNLHLSGREIAKRFGVSEFVISHDRRYLRDQGFSVESKVPQLRTQGEILKSRQLVYLYPEQSIEKIAKILNLTIGQVRRDRDWLFRNGLFVRGKTIIQILQESIEQKEQGLIEKKKTGPKPSQEIVKRDKLVLVHHDKPMQKIIKITGLTENQVYLSFKRLRAKGLIEKKRGGIQTSQEILRRAALILIHENEPREQIRQITGLTDNQIDHARTLLEDQKKRKLVNEYAVLYLYILGTEGNDIASFLKIPLGKVKNTLYKLRREERIAGRKPDPEHVQRIKNFYNGSPQSIDATLKKYNFLSRQTVLQTLFFTECITQAELESNWRPQEVVIFDSTKK